MKTIAYDDRSTVDCRLPVLRWLCEWLESSCVTSAGSPWRRETRPSIVDASPVSVSSDRTVLAVSFRWIWYNRSSTIAASKSVLPCIDRVQPDVRCTAFSCNDRDRERDVEWNMGSSGIVLHTDAKTRTWSNLKGTSNNKNGNSFYWNFRRFSTNKQKEQDDQSLHSSPSMFISSFDWTFNWATSWSALALLIWCVWRKW